jgi:hypothetical protein
MVTVSHPGALEPTDSTRAGNARPIAALLLLSPIIGEVLNGATRLSFMFALIPEIMVWGCGTLIIRELTRRWRGGILTMVLLGLALAIAEEFIIQQTSLAPLPWLDSATPYGRLWGVNWVYFLSMLGYETVWVVLVPVLVVELIYPLRRAQPWLRTRGMVIAAAVFLLGSFIAWFLWIKQARPNVFHVPDYQPPTLTLLLGLAAIAALGFAARALRNSDAHSPTAHAAKSPWIVGVTAIAFGVPWYILIVLAFVPDVGVPFWIAMAVGVAWATAAFLVLRDWAFGAGWGPMHGWALAFAALLVNMSCGFLGSNYWPAIDVYAKIGMNVVAVLCMLALARRLGGRPGKTTA